MRILVVDDEPDILELVGYNLTKEGFEVELAKDGADAFEKITKNRYDLLILDLMLPLMSGLDICKAMKRDMKLEKIPIIMLTAKADEVDRVIGLELGADDYVTKPFSPRELIARVKAVLRRMRKEEKAALNIIMAGDITLDLTRYAVFVGEKEVEISATEFKLLEFLMKNKGKVFTREKLLDSVWKDEKFVEERNVDVHITRLRSAIEKDNKEPRYIKTKWGVGYYFSED